MSIDPKILKRMQGEDSFLQSQTRGSRRVKLNRGQNWIVRFLPAQMGPDGLWFARIAKHWMNKLPIVCPRNTAEDFGGDPDCECPVCTLADELNDSADEIISKFGYKSKANHLTYLGDSTIGRNVNIGAGTITCNYDGANKHRTVIEDDVFVGSDTQFVAPVTVGRGTTIGAGSTITRNTPPDELTLSRAKQVSVPGWKRPVKKPREG